MIEAIPNVSEGRDSAIIAELESAITGVPGVVHLGTASDPDHNRTVFTYVADSADPLRDATLRLFEVAARRIDLRQQKGEHPRVGAVDVVPFVPLDGTEMSECVTLAHEVGRAVAHRFDLPVFLYEHAASSEHRRLLPAIRSGGLDRLSRAMAHADWKPDYGPSEPHPSAGVSIIGARRILIAFNVQLASDDMELAGAIARAVRESNGGLPAVRALPIRLASRGLVQVSMNLIDYEVTSLWQAFEAVRREADARGVAVVSSEIIGLAPAAAFVSTAAEAISLGHPSSDLVLENRIRALIARRE